MLSESQNQALKAQLVEHEALVREMYHWTATHHIKSTSSNFTFDDNGYCVTARHMTRLSESVDSFLGHYQSTLLPFQTCILDYDVASTT
ncbi:hypothetical protein H257_18635, partial [Aphanomyces astaci]